MQKKSQKKMAHTRIEMNIQIKRTRQSGNTSHSHHCLNPSWKGNATIKYAAQTIVFGKYEDQNANQKSVCENHSKYE